MAAGHDDDDDDTTTPHPSSVPMALAHVARTIDEFLRESESAAADAAAAWRCGEEERAEEACKGEGESPATAAARREGGDASAAALVPLLIAQLKDVVQSLGNKQQQQQQQQQHRRWRWQDAAGPTTTRNPWAFAYHQSRGARAEGVRALLRLLIHQLRAGGGGDAASVVLAKATMGCLVALLERDRAHHYLAVRVFEEEEEETAEGGGVGLQGILLHAYAACWDRGGEGENEGESSQQGASFLSSSPSSSSPSSSSASSGPRSQATEQQQQQQQQQQQLQALFLRLWALLAASQPLELPASDLPLLARILLAPIYRATASSPPLSPPRRRRQRGVQGGEEREDERWGRAENPHPLLVPSLELLAQAARASPALRLCLRARNHRERNMCVSLGCMHGSSKNPIDPPLPSSL
jgi:hypothetical protein